MSINMAEVHLREATLADTYRSSQVMVSAFLDDPLSSLIFPHRREHLEEYRERYHSVVRKGILDPESVCLVAEVDVYDEKTGESKKDIVGFVYWVRRWGKNEEEEKKRWKKGRDSWLKWTERMTVNYLDFLEETIATNPAGDPQVMAAFPKWFDMIADKYWKDESHWYLKIIATDEKYQRRGIGKKLVQWGVDKSEEEGVVAVLESSPKGERLYLGLGFEEVGTEKLTAENGKSASLNIMKRYPKKAPQAEKSSES